MPQWPGDPPFDSWLSAAIARGDEANVTTVTLCAHTGTHVDAPLHYLPGAAAVEALPLDVLIGPATVASLPNPPAAERLLLKVHTPGEDALSPALTPEQIRTLLNTGVKLLGVDRLSVGDAEVHRLLLHAGVVIVEGLDLSAAEPGEYDFVCLPIKLESADGAPARAVLRRKPAV
ncbi:MAG: cyclase family protein [Bryobacterales bacterium]|nr:cyclase family protein [Bryobacterales bacterium]